MDEAVTNERAGREQPDDLGAGPLPDADLATDQNQLGGEDTVEAASDDDRK